MKFCCWMFAAVLSLPLPILAQKPAVRPAITGIATVSVYASDMAKSRGFYGKFLGFPEIHLGSRRYRVNEQQTIQVDLAPHGETDFLESIALATPDVEAMRSYLVGNGVQVSGRIERRADGAHWFQMKDPEGHRIEFVQAPSSPTAMHGGEDQVSHHILHAGFVVRDRAAEDHFFRDILGFHQAWQGGATDKKTDWVDMQVPNGGDWIEYMLHAPGPVTAQ
ncbi:MAG: VOC family protein, partial [Acidobacteriaceae bacterium]